MARFYIMKSRNASGGLVYSTEFGRMCPQCRQPSSQCQCASVAAIPAGDGVVRVQRETKGRNGKAVTVVKGAPLGVLELAQLGKQLKNACGSGGTVKDGVMKSRVIIAIKSSPSSRSAAGW